MMDAMREGWAVTRVKPHWYRGRMVVGDKPLVFFARSWEVLIEKMAAYQDRPLHSQMIRERNERQLAELARGVA